MKNLHLLKTDKPSRIYLIKSNNKLGITSDNPEFTENFGGGTQNQNIYITNSEEIKEGVDVKDKWVVSSEYGFVIKADRIENNYLMHSNGGSNYLHHYKFIILTTDQDLIKDGIQAIDDEFLEWFIKNPSCEEVTVTNLYGDFNPIKYEYKIIIPREEPKQDLEKEMFELEQELDIPSNLRYHNSKPKQDYLQVPISVLRYISELEQAKELEKEQQGYSEEELLTFGKSCFYKGFEKSEKDDANCYTAFREEIGGLIEQFKKK